MTTIDNEALCLFGLLFNLVAIFLGQSSFRGYFSVDSYQLRVLLNLLTVGLIVSLYKINECIVCIIQILNF